MLMACLLIKIQKKNPDLHMKNKIYKTIVTAPVAVLFLMASFLPLHAQSETISYVSDELTVPLRSGTSNQHRIILFIKSGAALKILEVSEDGSYSRVSTPDGKEGWVDNSNLMNQSSARDRLVGANNKLSKSREMVKDLKKTIADLKTKNRNLNNQLAASDKKGGALEGDIAHLKKVTANPLALANKNRTLEDDLKTATTLNEQLKNKNERLSDDSIKEWFILGATVSLGSLLFGLLITRIRWQKKSSWGDF
jgi:SH3 domain protein